MDEAIEAIKKMNKYLRFGERKALAEKHGLKYQHVKDLLSGRRKPTEADQGFLTACYDKALPRKQKMEKFKAFA